MYGKQALGVRTFVLPPGKLRIKGLAPPPYTTVLDLEPRLRCRECDAKGKAVVSVRRGAAWGRRGGLLVSAIPLSESGPPSPRENNPH